MVLFNKSGKQVFGSKSPTRPRKKKKVTTVSQPITQPAIQPTNQKRTGSSFLGSLAKKTGSKAMDAVRSQATAQRATVAPAPAKTASPYAPITTQKKPERERLSSMQFSSEVPDFGNIFKLGKGDAKFTPQPEATQGERLRFSADVPEPTVATPEDPLKTIGMQEQQAQTGAPKSDRERLIDITTKQIRAAGGYSELDDDELRFMIGQKLPQEAAGTTAMDAAQTAMGEAITTEEDRMRARELEMMNENEKKMALYSDKLETQFGVAMDTARENGEKRKSEMRQSMSFSGFGRSTKNAENVDEIQKDVNTQIDLLEATKAAELHAYQMQLNGATGEEMEGIRSQINGMRQQERQMSVDVAQATAEMNAANQVSTSEAIDNIMASMPSTTVEGRTVDKYMSEQLEYLSDKSGNPVMTDADGNSIPTKVAPHQIEWGSYTDPYTQQEVYYDKSNPNHKLATGFNPYQGYSQTGGAYTGEAQYPLSAPSSYSGEAVDVTDSYPGARGKHADNCVYWARDEVTNIPSGADTIGGRIKGIQTAETGGFGGFDMSQVRVGDAIHTKEGDVGHTAIVRGFGEKGTMILEEANYPYGRITYGRELAPNDQTVIGWVRDPKNKGVNANMIRPRGADEQPEASVPDKLGIGGTPQFDQMDMARYAKALDGGGYPTFSGASQQVKDMKEAEFKRNAAIFAGQRSRGEVTMEEYNPTEYRELKKDFSSSGYEKDLKVLDAYNRKLKQYVNLFDDVGFITHGEDYRVAESIQADLITLQNKVDGLGALAGADLELLTAKVPKIYGIQSAGMSAISGGKEGMQKLLKQTLEEKLGVFDRTLNTAESTYSELMHDPNIKQYRDTYSTLLSGQSEQGYQPTSYMSEIEKIRQQLN